MSWLKSPHIQPVQVQYNCFIKNAHKISRILFPTLFVKTTDFQLDFNFEQMRTVTIFGEQGIMAQIP